MMIDSAYPPWKMVNSSVWSVDAVQPSATIRAKFSQQQLFVKVPIGANVLVCQPLVVTERAESFF